MSKPTLIEVVKSVLAAFAGVQSRDNREKDFASGSASTYIFVGIGVTILFVLLIVFVVSQITGS
ncbi:MAG: DUF2970 domain-containing protein [Methylococcaceae bacterium]|nr:DUF2970 domain-containing protein [Methylococcaceae bacterium]